MGRQFQPQYLHQAVFANLLCFANTWLPLSSSAIKWSQISPCGFMRGRPATEKHFNQNTLNEWFKFHGWNLKFNFQWKFCENFTWNFRLKFSQESYPDGQKKSVLATNNIFFAYFGCDFPKSQRFGHYSARFGRTRPPNRGGGVGNASCIYTSIYGWHQRVQNFRHQAIKG